MDHHWLQIMTFSEFWMTAIPLPCQLIPRGRNVIAMNGRAGRLDHVADGVHEHLHAIVQHRDFFFAVGAGPWHDLNYSG
jgi:hypothetical protein